MKLSDKFQKRFKGKSAAILHEVVKGIDEAIPKTLQDQFQVKLPMAFPKNPNNLKRDVESLHKCYICENFRETAGGF